MDGDKESKNRDNLTKLTNNNQHGETDSFVHNVFHS